MCSQVPVWTVCGIPEGRSGVKGDHKCIPSVRLTVKVIPTRRPARPREGGGVLRTCRGGAAGQELWFPPRGAGSLAALPVGARKATAPVTASPSLAVESTPCFWGKVEVRGPGRPRVSPPCAGQSDVGAAGLPRDAARSPASLPRSLFHGGPSVAPFSLLWLVCKWV